MKIKYLSHSCFEIKNSKTLLIDPFFSKENSLAPNYEGKPDLVFITHEHFDHVDAARFDSRVICPPGLKFKNSINMKIGDVKNFDDVKVQMVASSHHQSKYPTGYVIEFENKRIYHPGDTYLDGIKPLGKINVLFVPIGGYYTMDAKEALKALDIIKPDLTIPMHFNTFSQIEANPEEFKANAEKMGFRVNVMKINEEIEI
jgi:L-ascorbate metabolism protein UlaG (beta-lactamase superfamily)